MKADHCEHCEVGYHNAPAAQVISLQGHCAARGSIVIRISMGTPREIASKWLGELHFELVFRNREIELCQGQGSMVKLIIP